MKEEIENIMTADWESYNSVGYYYNPKTHEFILRRTNTISYAHYVSRFISGIVITIEYV